MFLFSARTNASPLPDRVLSEDVVDITNIAPYFNYHTECDATWKNSVRMKYIYFVEPSLPNVTLSISTSWIIRHPKNVAKALAKGGFKLTTSHTTNCGWIIVSTVSNLAVKRGEIRFKQTEGLDVTIYYSPKEETITKIEDLLKNTYPTTEIALVVICSTSPVWLWVLLIVSSKLKFISRAFGRIHVSG